MKRVLTLTMLVATLSACALGQYTTTPLTTAQRVADQVARLTALLTLTSVQQTQATTIFTAEETAEVTIQASIQTAQTSLQTAIEKNDQASINTLSTQIGNLFAQQISADAKADAAFYLLLTAAQQTQYNSVKLLGFDGVHGPGNGPGDGRGGFRH